MHTKLYGSVAEVIAGSARMLAMIVAGALLFAAPTLAQDSAIFDELQRLRRDLDGLQQYVYRGDNGDRRGVTGAGTGAGSDGGPAQMQFNARIQRKLQELQERMRELTGLVEEVQHNIGRVGARMDKLVGDVDLRLQLLEQNRVLEQNRTPGLANDVGVAAPIVGEGPIGAARIEDRSTTVISSAGVQRAGAPIAGTLGTVSENAVDSIRRGEAIDPKHNAGTIAPGLERRAVARSLSSQPNLQSAATAAPAPGRVSVGRATVASAPRSVLPAGAPKDQYNFALSLLRKRNYPGAEIAFREFIEKHPDNDLSGNAMYWMGETFYVRKDFAEAARIFLDGYQRFPTGGKAAGNLLKLAKSLSEIGEVNSACASYKELLSTFPDAGARTLSTARHESARLKCS